MRLDDAFQRAHTAAAVAALATFAWLAQRHVGESFFLADQVDQLQNFESLLRLRPEGLWGPVMSGTTAHALGPLGAIVFGLPVTLGLGIDAIHAVTSLLIAFATGYAFFALASLNRVLAWAWLLVFTTMRIVWWNAGIFWVNTLLLPLGLVMLAVATDHLRRPRLTKLGLLLVLQLLALHVHLVALVALPPLILIAMVTLRPALQHTPGRWAAGATVAGIVISLSPYAVAEANTDFGNTRAMLDHLRTAVQSDDADGRMAARETLEYAADPVDLLADAPGVARIGVGVLMAAAGLALWIRRRSRPVVVLVLAAILAIAGQAIFFLAMSRPLNGLHYVTILSPYYALLPAALLAAIAPDADSRWHQPTAVAAGLGVVAHLFVRGPVLSDRSVERTPWSYQAIVRALDRLCEHGSAHTLEGPGLRDDLNPSYDGVLRYLMTRGFSRCRYDAGADVLIAAQRDGEFEAELDLDGRRYRREVVEMPGLARYRRVP